MATKSLTIKQETMLDHAKNLAATCEKQGTTNWGLLVSGHDYRTAIALEKRGLGTVQYQGPGRGWFRTEAEDPLTTTVRETYASNYALARDKFPYPSDIEQGRAEFDAALEVHDARIRKQALAELRGA